MGAGATELGNLSGGDLGRLLQLAQAQLCAHWLVCLFVCRVSLGLVSLVGWLFGWSEAGVTAANASMLVQDVHKGTGL